MKHSQKPNATYIYYTEAGLIEKAAGLWGKAWLQGKLGYAWNRVLVYGKGGFAWVSNSNSSAPFSVSTNSTSWGWTGGIGVEGHSPATGRCVPNTILSSEPDIGSAIHRTLPFTNDTITVNNRSIQMITAGGELQIIRARRLVTVCRSSTRAMALMPSQARQ
jgi:hypothetical protein